MNKCKILKFREGQHIFCNSSSHQGQTTTIVKANDQRLRVKFDNPSHDDMFVDITDATIVADNFNPMKGPDPHSKVTNITPKHHTSGVATKASYYAVAKEQNTSIYNTWEQCNNQANGCPNAEFKRFNNHANAVNFLEMHTNDKLKINAKSVKLIYNDTKLKVLPLILKKLTIISSNVIQQSCNDENDIEYFQKYFFNEGKKHLILSTNNKS